VAAGVPGARANSVTYEYRCAGIAEWDIVVGVGPRSSGFDDLTRSRCPIPHPLDICRECRGSRWAIPEPLTGEIDDGDTKHRQTAIPM